MNVQTYLGQLRNIDRRIKDKIEESEKWHDISLNPGIGISEVKVQTSISPDRMGDAVALAITYEQEAKDLSVALTELKHTIIRQIDGMDSQLHYNLLKGFYIYGKTYSELGVQEGYSYKQTKRHFADALEAFEAKYGYTFLDQKPYLETVA